MKYEKTSLRYMGALIMGNEQTSSISAKKVVTPYGKLVKKINRDFPKKKLIGDIQINGEEFDLLIKHLRAKYKTLVDSYTHQLIDPVFCVALVQIGIRNYDGNYWGYVRDYLDNKRFNPNHQKWIGESFTKTLKKYNKIQLSGNERVDSILLHSFVTDNYANKFFDFLYAFYKIDLDRDISRLDKDTMNDLIQVIEKNDNTGRTYYLVEHTADTVRLNRRGAKNRIRRYIKLIDKAFWGDPLPTNSSNRLMKHFLNWVENSAEFIKERSIHGSSGRGRLKSFSKPYLKYDERSNSYSLVLPPQIIKFEDADDIYWEIENDHRTIKFEMNPYTQGVMGYKTELERINVESIELFDEYNINLMNGENKLRRFRIVEEKIRFFDKEGDFVLNDSIQPGRMFSITPKDFIPESEAILDSYEIGEILKTEYDLMKGDIVRIPDEKPISVGGKIVEGLLRRGKISGIKADRENNIPVYSEIPCMFIRMNSRKAPGTAIYINNKMYRFYNNGLASGISSFELMDRTDDTGYMIDLREFGCDKDGVYKIKIDIPNDSSINQWSFVLIRGFSYSFEDAPYIYKTRGTLAIPKAFELINKDTLSEHDGNKIKYSFDIIPGERYVYFQYRDIEIGFEIPALFYKFQGEEWLSGPHIDIWHSDFNPKLCIIYNSDKIKISLDDTGEDFEAEHYDVFIKNKSKGWFECDLNKFKSWFGRNHVYRKINIEFSDHDKPVQLLRVITKSTFKSASLKMDTDSHKMVGDFDIIGNSDYYVDVRFGTELIFEKIKLKNKSFDKKSDLRTGIYTVDIFESEEDEFGFGNQEFYPIGSYKTELLNPENLTGICIEVTRLHSVDNNVSYLPLAKHYRVVDLEKTSIPNVYKGKMLVGKKIVIATFPVMVEFFDIHNLQQTYITFLEEDDYEEGSEFLYDELLKYIVKHEDISLSKSSAYRRYKISLFPEDYVFDIKFIESPQDKDIEVDDKKYNNLIEKTKTKEFMKNSIFKR